MLQKQIVQELTRRTLAVEHENRVLFQLLNRDLLLFQIKICRVCNEYIGQIADSSGNWSQSDQLFPDREDQHN